MSGTSLHRAVLDSLGDGIMVFDAGWCIVLVNRVAEQLLGISARDMVGQIIGRDLLFLDQEQVAVYRDVMRHREERPLRELRVIGPDGGERVYDGEVRPAAGGGIIVLYRDVTRRAAREAAARVAAEEAQQLLVTISHELRSPLNAVLGYADLLETEAAGPVSDQQREMLSRLSASGHHLLTLVNELLDLAKLDSGRLTVERERGSASEAVAAALVSVTPQATARGLTLVESCRRHDDAIYLGDEGRVRQILINLLANGVAATEPGGHVSITCGTGDGPPGVGREGGGPCTYVRVSDTGTGIPADRLAHIFEPFSQAGASRGGTGLGLTLSREFARRMGGEITVQSAPGRGSTFTLWLPGAPPPPSATNREAREESTRAP